MRQFTLITSEEQLEEIERVVAYKKLERFIEKPEAQIQSLHLHSKASLFSK